MLKSLFPHVAWEQIRAVGFDMDGTLYDELDFIIQVYLPIAEELAVVCNADSKTIYERILYRWMEKGSSYNYIFDEVLTDFAVEKELHDITISKCVRLYRVFNPVLVLPKRSRIILDFFQKTYGMFLISDGSASLQSAKFRALGLDTWFVPENVAISGRFGAGYQKPATLMLDKIKLLEHIPAGQVVFFGDRYIDKEFANNAGFYFLQTKCFLL